MFEVASIQFGDIVKISNYSDKNDLNFSGKMGEVLGHTQPSSTGLIVHGDNSDDFAFGVQFEEEGDTYWFSKDIVSFVERPPMEIEIGGMKAVRDTDGNWIELGMNAAPDVGENLTEVRKLWWKFW